MLTLLLVSVFPPVKNKQQDNNNAGQTQPNHRCFCRIFNGPFTPFTGHVYLVTAIYTTDK